MNEAETSPSGDGKDVARALERDDPQALARAAREPGLADDAFTVLAVGATRRFAPRAP